MGSNPIRITMLMHTLQKTPFLQFFYEKMKKYVGFAVVNKKPMQNRIIFCLLNCYYHNRRL